MPKVERDGGAAPEVEAARAGKRPSRGSKWSWFSVEDFAMHHHANAPLFHCESLAFATQASTTDSGKSNMSPQNLSLRESSLAPPPERNQSRIAASPTLPRSHSMALQSPFPRIRWIRKSRYLSISSESRSQSQKSHSILRGRLTGFNTQNSLRNLVEELFPPQKVTAVFSQVQRMRSFRDLLPKHHGFRSGRGDRLDAAFATLLSQKSHDKYYTTKNTAKQTNRKQLATPYAMRSPQDCGQTLTYLCRPLTYCFTTITG